MIFKLQKNLGNIKASLLFIGILIATTPSFAIFIDGKGHYSLRGGTANHPAFDKGAGLYQAIEQNFLLDAEARVSDKASVWLQFKLFDNSRGAYLGDVGQPNDCSPLVKQPSDGSTGVANTGNANSCAGRHQDPEHPGWKPYTPTVSEAYVTYATDYCLIKAGRRPRNWGLGVFLNSGEGPFDTTQSVYDGVTCEINVQKTQTLGFAFGYDKLAESGAPVEVDLPQQVNTNGAMTSADDLDQFFFVLEYDDRKTNAGSGFSEDIGFYFANVVSGHNAPSTDIKYADFYAGFFLRDFTIKHEVLFRLGKSSDPSFARLGGASSIDGNVISNNVNTIAGAGSIEYTLKRSGEVVGPAEFHQGTAESHSLFLEYAYAPGDSDGYQSEFDGAGHNVERTNHAATAFAFNRNYKPALILFNSPPNLDHLRVDGVFDPDRVMNAIVLATGYRYSSLENGNVEIRLIGAQLNDTMPGYVVTQYANSENRLIGYSGASLGYEVDLKFDKSIGKYVNWGLAGGLAIPGEAWKIHQSYSPIVNGLVQAFTSLSF